MNKNVRQLVSNLTSAKESLQRNGGGGRIDQWIDEQLTLLRLIEEDYATARETFSEASMSSFDGLLAGAIARKSYRDQVQDMMFWAIRNEPMDMNKVTGYSNLYNDINYKYMQDCEMLVSRFGEHLTVVPIPFHQRDQ